MKSAFRKINHTLAMSNIAKAQKDDLLRQGRDVLMKQASLGNKIFIVDSLQETANFNGIDKTWINFGFTNEFLDKVYYASSGNWKKEMFLDSEGKNPIASVNEAFEYTRLEALNIAFTQFLPVEIEVKDVYLRNWGISENRPNPYYGRKEFIFNPLPIRGTAKERIKFLGKDFETFHNELIASDPTLEIEIMSNFDNEEDKAAKATT